MHTASDLGDARCSKWMATEARSRFSYCHWTYALGTHVQPWRAHRRGGAGSGVLLLLLLLLLPPSLPSPAAAAVTQCLAVRLRLNCDPYPILDLIILSGLAAEHRDVPLEGPPLVGAPPEWVASACMTLPLRRTRSRACCVAASPPQVHL